MDLKHYDQINLLGANMLYQDFLNEDELCATIQKEISPLIKDSDFADMYKGGGRPPVSPRVLLLTTIMQYLERLPDRAAATNLKYRLDWKIAFGLEVGFKGINHTTLVYFRNRLLESEKSTYAFDKILEHLSSLGFIKKGQKQRIDSTHIIGNVRELSRLELFHETLRLFCKDVEKYQDEMDSELLDYYEYYIEKISIRGISNIQKNEFIEKAGLALRGFAEWGNQVLIISLESYQTLVKVFAQNFTDKNPDPDDSPKMIKIATGKDHICSPHETDARYASKGGKGWLGYKLQVAETVTNGETEVNFITYIELNDATDFDGDSVSQVIKETSEKDFEPSILYGDTHYNTADNIKELKKEGIDLRGPVMPNNSNPKEKNIGFDVRMKEKKVICPEGIGSKRFRIRKNGFISSVFPVKNCKPCKRRKICQPEPRGKYFTKRIENEVLEKRRKEMKTEEFKEEMHQRNGIEGTISGLVRGQGARRSRYKDKGKARLQIKFSGAAANIKRLHRKKELERSYLIKSMNAGFEKLIAA